MNMAMVAYVTGLPPAVALLGKATVVLGVAWLLHVALGSQRSKWRALVWRGAVVALALLPVAQAALPGLPVTLGKPEPIAPPTFDVPVPPARAVAGSEAEPATAKTAPSPPAPIANEAPSGYSIAWRHIWIPWVVVAAVMIVRLAGAMARLASLTRTARPAPEEVRRQAADMAREAGWQDDIPVLVTKEQRSPFLAGLRRPIIVLPESILENEEGRTAAIAHEIAHLTCRDLAWGFAIRCLAACLWFHPLAWRMGAAHSSACERVCDADAATRLGDADRYARVLARTALALAPEPAAMVAAPMLRTTDVTGRIHALKRGLAPPPARRAIAWAVIAIVCGVAVLGAVRPVRPFHGISRDRLELAAALEAAERRVRNLQYRITTEWDSASAGETWQSTGGKIDATITLMGPAGGPIRADVHDQYCPWIGGPSSLGREQYAVAYDGKQGVYVLYRSGSAEAMSDGHRAEVSDGLPNFFRHHTIELGSDHIMAGARLASLLRSSRVDVRVQRNAGPSGDLVEFTYKTGRDRYRRVYLDPRRGYAVVRRQLVRQEKDGTRPRDVIAHDSIASAFREVTPGVWLPSSVTLTWHHDPESERPAERARMTIGSIVVNSPEVDIDTFDLPIPADYHVETKTHTASGGLGPAIEHWVGGLLQ